MIHYCVDIHCIFLSWARRIQTKLAYLTAENLF